MSFFSPGQYFKLYRSWFSVIHFFEGATVRGITNADIIMKEIFILPFNC